jgi:hypothetical protein
MGETQFIPFIGMIKSPRRRLQPCPSREFVAIEAGRMEKCASISWRLYGVWVNSSKKVAEHVA